MTVWVPALLAGAAATLVVPPRTRWPGHPQGSASRPIEDDPGWVHRGRWLWSLLAALGGGVFVSGPWGAPAGAFAGAIAWVWIGRVEPAASRRRREATERDLPGLVHLLGVSLESGCGVAEALTLVCEALPGPAAEHLAAVPARLSLGVTPEAAWRPVLGDRALAPLGRAMVRAHRSGASVTHEVARLADELDRRARLRVEERARAVGVKAAVPLGLCLLPSFLLIGVVPLVASLLQSLDL